jgi:hypothetical protein
MTRHWHGYSYTGHTRPPDRDARDHLSATPPLVIAEWPRKPRSMMAGTFTDAGQAVAWLETELSATPPLPTSLPADVVLENARVRLLEAPGDQVTRYYTASGYVCRDVVLCPPEGPCPRSPG